MDYKEMLGKLATSVLEEEGYGFLCYMMDDAGFTNEQMKEVEALLEA